MKTPLLCGPSRTPNTAMAFSTASATRYLCLAGQLAPYAFGYVPRTTEGSWRFSVSEDGSIDDLEVYISANTRTTATTFTLMVNGVSSGYTATVGAGVTGWVGASGGPISVNENDLLSVRMVTGSGSGSLTIDAIQSSFTADSGDTVAHYTQSGDYNFNASITTQQCGPLQGTVEGNGFGSSWGSVSSFDAYAARIQQDATATHLSVDIPANSTDVAHEVELYVNNAASGLKVTVPAATTGRFVATGAVNIAPDDALDIRHMAVSAATGAIRIGDVTTALTYDGDSYDWIAGPRPSDSLQGYADATYFIGPNQNHIVSAAPGIYSRFKLYEGTMKNLWARVNRAGATAGNWPVSEVRVAGAAAMGIVVDGGVTGSETIKNTANEVPVNDGDSLWFALRTTNFSQAISSWGFTLDSGGAPPVVIDAGTGALSYAGQAPYVTADEFAEPGAGALAFAGQQPTLLVEAIVELGSGTLTLTGQAPALSVGITIGAGAGELSFAGNKPFVANDAFVAATQSALLVLGGVEPSARATQSAVLMVGEVVPDVRASQSAILVLVDSQPCVSRRADVWVIHRRDGESLAFTSHDEPLPFGGLTASPCGSLTPSAVEQAAEISAVGNLELSGLVTSSKITEDDLYGGVYDDAFVEVWRVSWSADIPEAPVRLAAGWWGNLTHGDEGFSVEILGPASRLQQQSLVQMVTPGCRRVFGSPQGELPPGGCGVDLEARKRTGELTAVRNRARFTAAIDAGPDSPQWANGTLTFLAGPNAGTYEVKSVDFGTGEIVLWAPTPYLASVGDAFELKPGCDKLKATCKLYDNFINFGGFPDLPGTDAITETPDAKL